MFCPKCKSEYRENFTECEDCKVQLVNELFSEPNEEDVDLVQVLETRNHADIALIKSILDAEDIFYYFHGEFFNQMRPLLEPARLMVKSIQFEKVKEILENIILQYSPFPKIDNNE